MRSLGAGEKALLINYIHLNADTPYRASHAIFVREGATVSYDQVDEIPEMMRIRTLDYVPSTPAA